MENLQEVLLMERLSEFVDFVGGTPQSRLFSTIDTNAPVYKIYGQANIQADLVDDNEIINNNQIRTFDNVKTLYDGDVIFNLISGQAANVRLRHEGFLQTQNFVKIIPNEKLDRHYLVFLLNEDELIMRQLLGSLQGSAVIKYTLSQLKALKINRLPTIEEQKIIGKTYFDQIRLNWLRKKSADLKLKLAISHLGKD